MFKTLIWILLLFAVAQTSLAVEPPPERDGFTVAILGDRTGGEPEGIEMLRRAVYELNQINPDFVIHIGDMVQGYTRDDVKWMEEYEEFVSAMDKLNVPWYPTAGNHDVFTPVWDPNDRTFEELYQSYFGPLYYSFDYKNSHFVVMYTDEAMASKPVISSQQIEWLKKDLAGTQKTNIFVFMHKPAWRYNDSNWDTVHQIIKNFPVKAVVAGHFHAYQKDMNKDGIQYYLMGVTGAEAFISENDLTGWINHYNLLRVDGDKFTMAVVKLGNVESDDYILTEDYEKMWTISKLPADKTGSRGWLWQPTASSVEGEIEVYAYNPLDVEIPVELLLNPDMGSWSMEPPSLSFNLPPNSSSTAKVTLSSPKANSIFPPEFEFQYLYTDSRGDQVPIVVRNRVFLRDAREVHKYTEPAQMDGMMDEAFWEQVTPVFNHTWIYSVYERYDAPPEVYLAADNENLYFFAVVMDSEYSYLKDSLSDRILSDTIVFSTLPSGSRREIVIFPFNPDMAAFQGKVDDRGILRPSALSNVPGVEYKTRADEQADYYYCEGRIPLSALFGDEPVSGRELPFNVEVIDNDLEAFIYLRSWAFDQDPQYWGILKFTGD